VNTIKKGKSRKKVEKEERPAKIGYSKITEKENT